MAHRQAAPDDEALIREKPRAAVDALIDEPVQTFTPLLAGNQVLSELQDPGRGAAEEPQPSQPA